VGFTCHALPMRYGQPMTRPKPSQSEPLPSRPGGGQIVAGILAGLEHLIANRPRPVTQIEERHREPWASANGLTVNGLEDEIERPEAPDRSGARL
jgi:hypothetical protein